MARKSNKTAHVLNLLTAPGEALVGLAGPGTLAAPGQTCAVYDGDTVVAGGTIA